MPQEDQCQAHGAHFERLDNQFDALEATMRTVDGKLNRLLERSEQWLVNTTTALAEVAGIKRDVAEIKVVIDQQWRAINELRRIAYGALALAVGVPTALGVLATLYTLLRGTL